MAIGHELPTQLIKTCTDGTLVCFAKWAYRVTFGMFWVFALFGFCVAIFMAASRLGNARAFGFASFVGMIGSIFFATLGILTWWIATVFILVGAIGIIIMIMNKK